MVRADARPEKESFLLVTFNYGDGAATQAKYTDWDQSFLGHTPEPRMSVQLADNEATFDKRETRIILPVDDFTGRAGDGTPHSPMFVKIEELTQGLFAGDQSALKVLFRGRVIRTTKNFQGKRNQVAFFALTQKSRLDVSMGIPCNHHCAWTLFHGGCGVDEDDFDVLTEIDSVDGQEVTITDVAITGPGTADPRYWKRGYLEKDGLRVGIRDYDGSVDPTKLFMVRRVPTDWIGGSSDIRAVPGCDKTIETCRARFDAEEFFMGPGYAIPSYQPNLESPT